MVGTDARKDPNVFRLKIDTDNAAFLDPDGGGAFNPGYELARILREIANRIHGELDYTGERGTIRDLNGNTVGAWHYTGEGQ